MHYKKQKRKNSLYRKEGSLMKLLLHTCCAPCSVYCIDSLREEGIEPTVYWYNPNIHLYKEYKARRDCLREYSKMIGVKAIFEEEYGLDKFCQNVVGNVQSRCSLYCYPVRLGQAAKYAKEHGYDCFSTTLLVSPYQQHEKLIEIGNYEAKKYGIEFLYRDFRVGFKKGREKAKELGLYMQKYCGCLFSEEYANFENIKKDIKKAKLENEIVEREIRLNFAVPGLEVKKHKNGNKEERDFIYNLKKEEYTQSNLTEEDKIKIFERYMKEESKDLKMIFVKNNFAGFIEKEKNIKLLTEYKGIGIEDAILNEINL